MFLAAADIDRDETLGEMALGVLRDSTCRDHRWRAFVFSSPGSLELQVREVVRLDRVTELAVDLVDLGEDVLRLGALRDTIGSAAAVLTHAKATARKIAAINHEFAGAFRLPGLISVPPTRNDTSFGDPGGGPGPSQAGHPSRRSGQPPPATRAKNAACSRRCSNHKQRHHSGELATVLALVGTYSTSGAARLVAVLTGFRSCWQPFRLRSPPDVARSALAGGGVPGRRRLPRRARARRDAREPLRARVRASARAKRPRRARRPQGWARARSGPPPATARDRAAGRSPSPSRASRRSCGALYQQRNAPSRWRSCSAQTRSTRRSPGSTASAARQARATGSSSRRGRARSSSPRSTRGSPGRRRSSPSSPRRQSRLERSPGPRRRVQLPRRPSAAAGSGRGQLAAIEAQARTAEQRTPQAPFTQPVATAPSSTASRPPPRVQLARAWPRTMTVSATGYSPARPDLVRDCLTLPASSRSTRR